MLNFDALLKYLNGTVHGTPEQLQEEVDAVKKILTDGQGYLRKDPPVQIVFFDEL